MKAIQYSEYGEIDVLHLSEVDSPSPQKDHVLIQVRAASINPFDVKMRNGLMKEHIPVSFPFTIGSDLAGTVIQVGEGVTDLKIGDEVYGQAGVLNGGSGAMAELAVTPIAKLWNMPQNIDFIEAGALPLVGISALQGIEDHLAIQSGQKILIHGGAGGTGSIAIQIAKHHDAYVVTTVGTRDVMYAKSLGADDVIDYKTQQFEAIVTGIDAVFDTVGGETLEKSLPVLKKGGKLVSMAGNPTQEQAEKYGVKSIGQSTSLTADRLKRLTELIEQEIVKVHVDHVFELSEFQEAFRYQETNHPRGKVVITVK